MFLSFELKIEKLKIWSMLLKGQKIIHSNNIQIIKVLLIIMNAKWKANDEKVFEFLVWLVWTLFNPNLNC